MGAVIEGSETVRLNGQILARGTDYVIYYDQGVIELKNPEASAPGAFQAWRRCSKTSSCTQRFRLRDGTSSSISSPSCTRGCGISTLLSAAL